MIIMDSDRYGLSQLYQLRGRVGRSNRQAYAYLMYQKDKVLGEQAEKRLRAIRDFTEFGSGFKIAMRDLEIRGAGNMLGTEQSGHMVNVGYELYCKMVDEAVRALQGQIVNDEEREITVDIKASAYIPRHIFLTKPQNFRCTKRSRLSAAETMKTRSSTSLSTVSEMFRSRPSILSRSLT